MDVFPEVKVRTLWNLSNHLGVLKTGASAVEDMLVADMWDDPKCGVSCCGLGWKTPQSQGTTTLLLDFAIQLAAQPAYPLTCHDRSRWLPRGWFLIRRAQKSVNSTPNASSNPTFPTRAVWCSRQNGLHENIAVLDFKSMYPNIMITYNLSPDTYLAPTEPAPTAGGMWP
jgi:DNA polymerase I